MASIKKTAPAKPSARRKTASAPRRPAAKSAAKPAAKPASKSAAKPASKLASAKQRASTAARRATLKATCKRADASLVVDEADEVGAALAERALARAEATATAPAPKKTRGPSGVTRTAVDRVDDPEPASGLKLLDRVSRSIEREITQIEAIVGGSHLKPEQRSEAERRARTLASLTKTLSELRRLRAAEQSRAADDDSVPRDLDEFRRALSRRLEQLVAVAAECPAAEHD
ncbi:pyruvate/2-oxoglutarate dehydrogenase complex dihydrolipoamide acyltransferase (E2) component [Rhodopseudomonas rhenobacensis]|uniref:Pyruvate/2-oxoglutarate dehydrogenase complex dihydrolipoamide acyltransferase (E2) component n=1 Tax=Rhodopseudomonas rhenobacensis TaxID=87461 RepID=A0A7W7Z4F0_9BRAD|nr:hypothetical protein [Rhodopseudomonas rhenobacensis]MBB5047815.1 pyruvate/2-oxoglutarate dehydrogenase complex dihydrolipoamide acyltransferase (E2) component [Rhodopseudomonas rhenobacensis]